MLSFRTDAFRGQPFSPHLPQLLWKLRLGTLATSSLWLDRLP